MIPLIVLRPEPGASATAARARDLGLDPIVAPLFEIVPVRWEPPADAFDALLLTSANALLHAGPALAAHRALPAYAVGAATAAAARLAGFRDIHTGDRDAADLLARVAADGRTHVLHLCGVERRAVAPPGMRIAAVPVYRAEPVTTLPAAIVEAIRHEAVALLHSPRAARLFADLVQGADRADVAIAAISPVAAEAAGSGWLAVGVAPVPTDVALLAVAARLCEDGG